MAKVIQLIPALNWTATFIDEETHLKGDSRPIVCWALDDDGSITGMVVEGKDVKSVHDVQESFSSYHCHESHSGL